MRRCYLYVSCALAAFIGISVFASAQAVTMTIPAGTGPDSVVVNPVTNKIYVTNFNGASVTVIDGATNATTAIATGVGPQGLAANPVTNTIYVANDGTSDVTVIDGATNTVTATVAAGTTPFAVAVNMITNTIYVVNEGSNNVTVINGATNTVTATVAAGSFPETLAVNSVTNMIYVANFGGTNVTVIDGATNDVTATVAVGSNPDAVVVNPVTNKIYVANGGSGSVTVIDGNTNTVTATVAAGTDAYSSVAVNPVTNKIYVANHASNYVTVIDGVTNGVTATVTTGTGPFDLALNTLTNQIYAVNQDSNNVTVIDADTNSVTATLPVGAHAVAVALNPVTNKVYTANFNSNNVTVIDGATNTTATVGAGTNPYGVAVNWFTNTVYVVNMGSNNVTGIDGATNTTTTIAAGTNPFAVAVNPVTNTIYVANENSKNVTVIDGVTKTTTMVAAGDTPVGAAVNPVTNRIYVTNFVGNSVTVIDGATNTTATISAGTAPEGVAVNPITNTIYVANKGSSDVTVINGANNTVIATVAAGTTPCAVAVNPATNMIYVANQLSSNVTVIDGATNTTATVAAGIQPCAVAVNPVTNKIYVPNYGSNNVTVIDGATNTTVTLAAVTAPGLVDVNPVTNKIYVPNESGNNMTVIDGATNTTDTVPAGNGPYAVAVNPVTNAIYVTNDGGNNVTVLTEEQVQPIPLVTTITAMRGNQTTDRTPVFTFTVTSSFVPIAPTPQAVYYQVDTWQGPWTQATGLNPTFSGQTATLSLGPHILYAYAMDGQETGIGGRFFMNENIGGLAAYPFIVMQSPTTTNLSSSANPSDFGQTVDLTASITGGNAGAVPTGNVTFLDGTNSLGSVTLASNFQAVLQVSNLTVGSHSLTAQYSGDVNFLASTSSALTQNVNQAITVTTASLPGGEVTNAYSQTLQSTGGTAPYSWSLASGSLPQGLNLSAAGVIAGKPITAGTSSFTVSVKDANGLAATSPSLSIVVVAQLAVTTTSLPAGALNAAFSQTLQAAGGTAPYTWSIASGNLPAGLSLSAAGTIAGTPTTAGTSAFTVSVKDANSFTATSPTLSIVVVSQLTVTTASLPAGAVNTAYSQTLQAAGGAAPYSWSIASGSLPAGLSLSATGTISGTPTAAGSSAFTVSVKDANNRTATSSTLSMVVVSQLTVTTTSLSAGALNAAYSQTLQVAGGTAPYTWSIATGSLPAGLRLSTAGIISGTPATAGTSAFTVSVKDANSVTASSPNLSIVVVSQLTVTTTSLPAGALNAAFSQTLQAAGGTAPYTWSIASGNLPAGLSLSAAGTIAGTPTTAGTSAFTVSVKDANSFTATSPTLSIVVVSQLTVTTTSLPVGEVSTAYSQTLQATGGKAPYSWSIASGSLPAGLSLSPGGTISGIPTAASTSGVTISVKDANSSTATSSALSILVESALTETTATLPAAKIGTAYGQVLQAAGGTAPYTWSIATGSLPGGLSLSATGIISGTPTAAGTSTFTVSVKDANSFIANKALSVVIIPQPVANLTGPSSVAPGDQPTLTVQLGQVYPLDLAAALTLTVQPDPNIGVDDPNIQFSTGGRTLNLTIPAGSTTTPAVQFQAGTVAASISVTLQLTTDGVDVTPSDLQPLVVHIPAANPSISSGTLARNGNELTVSVHGYSSTREMTQAAFTFSATSGATISDPTISISVGSAFSNWFQNVQSNQYGSSFTFTQSFTVSEDPSAITSVSVTLSNSVGTSNAQVVQ